MTDLGDAERRRFRPGFRVRVLGFSAALLAAATVVGIVVQRAVLLERLDRQVAQSLRQERRELESLASGRDPSTGQPFGGDASAVFDTFFQRNVPSEGEAFVTFVDGEPYAATRAPADLTDEPDLVGHWGSLTRGERGRLDTEAGPVEYLAVPLRDGNATAGVFVVANFVQGERDEIESGIRVEAVVAGLVLLVALGAAWISAGRLLRPVRELTESARAITESDLTRRIPVDGDDEIAELARTFNEMLDRLGSAFSSQRAFVDDAGHELRTPITIVRGHLELMDGEDPEDRQRTIALVTDELDRMARIVDDLLLLAKAEQPDFVRPEAIDLADLTEELLGKAQALGDRSWRLDGRGAGVLRGDPQRLTQAVLNLARNAVEHTEEGDEVALGSSRQDGEVRLWVRDVGPGIARDDRERIFERFARGRDRPRRSEGAGLGLAIAQAVAAGHGGRVELDSAPGAGATFTLVLPDPSDGRAGGDVDRPDRTPVPSRGG